MRTTTVPLRLVDNTLAEIAPAAPTEYELRAQRGALLTQSDWMVQPDVPVSDDLKARRLAYRQALRDIPEQPGWPNAVLWPDLPS